jgi:hypothetical protein
MIKFLVGLCFYLACWGIGYLLLRAVKFIASKLPKKEVQEPFVVPSKTKKKHVK